MKKLLLTTVAAAALAGYAGIASAQTTQGPAGAPGAGAAAKTENTRPAESKGALSGAIKGDVPGGHAQAASPEHAKSAQDASPASGEKLGQKAGNDEAKPMSSSRNAEEEKPDAKSQASGAENSAAKPRSAEEDNAKSGMNSAARSSAKGADAHGSVKLSQTQRSKIQAAIGTNHAARVGHVNFDVSVGVKIPSDIHVEVLPSRVVEVVPEYRGYDYIIVGDNILIIDPDTHEIVDIIAA